MTTISEAIRAVGPWTIGGALDFLDINPDLPVEWATVDRCLDWLRDRDYPPRIDLDADGAWVTIFDGFGDAQDSFRASTLHAALIAACQAVQETT